MKTIILLGILIFPIIITPQVKYNKDRLANLVIGVADKHGNEFSVIGTGTIINNATKIYLITASHVIDSIKFKGYLIFRNDKDKPAIIELSKFNNNVTKAWLRHKEADIAIIELIPFDNFTQSQLKSSSFPITQIRNNRDAVSRDWDVVAFGYPLVDKIRAHFSPLTFHSYYSSGLITLPRADTRELTTFQVLEDPSVQGYSGGPIFIGVQKNGLTVGPTNGTFLTGLVHGTYSDNTGGKLALITPAYYILELIK